jgi:hypothetical protein
MDLLDFKDEIDEMDPYRVAQEDDHNEDLCPDCSIPWEQISIHQARCKQCGVCIDRQIIEVICPGEGHSQSLSRYHRCPVQIVGKSSHSSEINEQLRGIQSDYICERNSTLHNNLNTWLGQINVELPDELVASVPALYGKLQTSANSKKVTRRTDALNAILILLLHHECIKADRYVNLDEMNKTAGIENDKAVIARNTVNEWVRSGSYEMPGKNELPLAVAYYAARSGIDKQYYPVIIDVVNYSGIRHISHRANSASTITRIAGAIMLIKANQGAANKEKIGEWCGIAPNTFLRFIKFMRTHATPKIREIFVNADLNLDTPIKGR